MVDLQVCSGLSCGHLLDSDSSSSASLRWPQCTPHWFTCGLAVLTALFRSPASGGEFQWVSEFAPAGQQRFLSYTTGMGF